MCLILFKHQKKSTVTSSSDLRKKSQRSKRSKNGVKFWTIFNGKTNTAKVLVGVKHQKVSTVTSSPDLWLRGQRSKKVKSQTTWNDQSNTVNVLILVKHQKQSTVTSSSPSSFWQHVFYIYFTTSDFDQTWSERPVPWPLLRHKQWWGQRSWWGHCGQKGHFHQKGIKSYRIPSIDAWLMYMH